MIAEKNALAKLLLCTEPERVAAGYIHTVAEIAAQPRLWLATSKMLEREFPEISDFLGSGPRLLLSGAGSSHFVGLSVVPALRRVFPGVEAIPSTEIVMDPESCFPREDFILVSFARSGDSPEGVATVALAEKLRSSLVRHLAITCNPEGELARVVGALGSRGKVVVLPEETNDRSLAMTSSFTSMALAGLSLGYAARGASGAFAELAASLAAVGESFIGRFSGVAASLVEEGFRRVFFVASRPFFGGALEAQLKVQELSGGAIIAKAEDTLGLRHGFMAAIDSDTLVLLFLSSDPYRRRYELDLAREIQSKGICKKLVAIAEEPEGLAGLADLVFETGTRPGLGDESRAIPTVLSGQLLGLFASLNLGLKPDSPSPSGVISRVVKGVTIHPYGTGTK
ncbi:MAG: sugar isomerase [Treponema sp.]|nr:sugar isomerase [Treponema sp.]